MASKSINDQVMNKEIIDENERNEKKSKQVVSNWDERERFEEKIDEPWRESVRDINREKRVQARL